MHESNDDEAVWAQEIAREFASRTDENYLVQISSASLIFEELVVAIQSKEVFVYVAAIAGGMTERGVREREPNFPVGDYRVRRGTAERWFAMHQASEDSSVTNKFSENKNSTETPALRRARWLDWYGKGGRGALQAVYKRELEVNPKADRSFIGKQIKVAQEEKADALRGGAWTSQLMQDGKRKD